MRGLLAAVVRLGVFLAALSLSAWMPVAVGRQCDHASAIVDVAAGELPQEAQRTILLIQQGGPFPFEPKDGSVFGNFERRLPVRARGYYHEYTVPTPGRTDRGARRIVAGSAADEFFYSDDHYRSFRHVLLP